MFRTPEAGVALGPQQLRTLECAASIIAELMLSSRQHSYREILLRLKPLPHLVRWLSLLAPHLRTDAPPASPAPPLSLVRLASGALAAVLMMSLTACAVDRHTPPERPKADNKLLCGLIAPLLTLVQDAEQPAPHLLTCALWGMAREPALREPLVKAGAVEALVAVMQRLLTEARIAAHEARIAAQAKSEELRKARNAAAVAAVKAKQAEKRILLARDKEEAEKLKEEANTLMRKAERLEEALMEGNGEEQMDDPFGGSVPGMLLEWSAATLWTLCMVPPNEEDPTAAAPFAAPAAAPAGEPAAAPDPLQRLHASGGVDAALDWLAEGPGEASLCARTLLVELLLVSVSLVPGLDAELFAKDEAEATKGSVLGLLGALGEERDAWPRQRRQAVRVLQLLKVYQYGGENPERARKTGEELKVSFETAPTDAEIAVLRVGAGSRQAVEEAMERAIVSQLSAAELQVQRFGCRALARLAHQKGKRKAILQNGGTAAALAICKRDDVPQPLLIEALTVLLNVSSEPENQVWLAANGLWSLVTHAFAPQTEEEGRLASATLTNLASNSANKPLMYRAELRLKQASWQASVKTAGGPRGRDARGGVARPVLPPRGHQWPLSHLMQCTLSRSGNCRRSNPHAPRCRKLHTAA